MTQDTTTGSYIIDWEEWKKALEEYNKPYQNHPYQPYNPYPQPCPGCGRCPVCGRRTSPNDWQPYITWSC